MKRVSVLFGYLSGSFATYILTPKLHLFMELRDFNEEHSVEHLATIGDFTVYRTDSSDYLTTLSYLYDIEEEQTYTVGEQNFVVVPESSSSVPWHLSRVTQRDLPLSGTFSYPSCHKNKEVDIHSYVIDTGIDVTHPEFEGRAEWLADFTGDSQESLNSHATHCAGIIGSKTFGACKDAKIFSVRVLDSQGSGSTSGVIAGIQYTFKRHQEQNEASGGKTRSIASVSLGGGFSLALNRVVEATLKDPHFYFAAAAGNEDSDACKTSPASAKGIFSVAASDRYDTRAYFSNFGKCTDIYAPGVNIASTVPGGKTAVFSGTSMSCPGLVSILNHYVDQYPELNNKQLKEKVLSDSTKDHITKNPNRTNNFLVYLHRD